MRRSGVWFGVLVMCSALMLQGCVAAVGIAIAEAERERFEKLRIWKADLDGRDCEGLGNAYVELIQQKDDYVDFDQREDHLREVFRQKGCSVPTEVPDKIEVSASEQERYARLRTWKASIAGRDCAGLNDAYGKLVLQGKDVSDFDDRDAYIRGEFRKAGCPQPKARNGWTPHIGGY